jgi:hypothetical protein
LQNKGERKMFLKKLKAMAVATSFMLAVLLGTVSLIVPTPSAEAYCPNEAFTPDEYTLALWHFDEGSGSTIHDSSGHGNDGTIYGASWATGRFDGGLDFVNGADYVVVPDNPDGSLNMLCGDEFTVELWIYARQISRNGYNWNDWMTKYAFVGGTHTGYVLYACEGYPTFHPTFYGIGSLNDDVPPEPWVPTPPTLEWVHVAVAYDGQSLKVYYNGVLIDSDDVGHNYLLGNDVPLIFGCIGSTPWEQSVNAVIDEVRISSKDRTKCIQATIDLDPDTLNLKSNGEFVTCYIELPMDYSLGDIDTSKVKLEGIPALSNPSPCIVDYDGDGISELMVKFDRAAVKDTMTDMIDYETGTRFYSLTPKVTGEVAGILFEGTDTIFVIKK